MTESEAEELETPVLTPELITRTKIPCNGKRS